MRLLACAALVIALLAACERASAPDALATQARVSVAAPRFSPEDPRLSVAHTGTRRFEFPRTSGPGGEYRERIATDGRGRFALEPLEAGHLTQSEWGEFELRQRLRQGFLFRYRDFLVRDADLFERHWTTTDLLRTESVAGRTCDTYRVERNGDEPSVAYEVALDQETGLVLASREYAGGRLIAEMVYETFQLDPDPDPIAWHQASNVERILPSVEALEQELQVQTLRPRLLPAGYALLEVASVVDGAGRTWLKLTYTDGVEPLFFLQALGDADAQESSSAGIGVEKLPAPSSVMVFQLGTATAIQGRVEGFSLIVIGKASEAELLDLIESSLP